MSKAYVGLKKFFGSTYIDLVFHIRFLVLDAEASSGLLLLQDTTLRRHEAPKVINLLGIAAWRYI